MPMPAARDRGDFFADKTDRSRAKTGMSFRLAPTSRGFTSLPLITALTPDKFFARELSMFKMSA